MPKKLILVFDRPGTTRFMQLYQTVAPDDVDIKYISDFKWMKNPIGLIEKQYQYLAKNKIELYKNDILLYQEIIARCRYLRQLEVDLAKKLINSIYLAIEELFTELNPSAVIGFPIDNYILDVLYRYCLEKKIFFIAPVASTLPDQIRLTTCGEKIVCTQPSRESIERYLSLLTEASFKPSYSVKHRHFLRLFFLYGKERVKKIFFWFRKTIEKNPYSFHYNCIYPLKNVITIYSVYDLFLGYLFLKKEKIEEHLQNKKYRKTVFLPLQVTPESALNYHIKDYRFSDYGTFLDKVIENQPDDILLIVKEHPAILGFRQKSFYDRFLNKGNILLIEPNIPVSTVLTWVDTVITTASSSTGVESIIKGKNVISFGGAFYQSSTCRNIESFDEVSQWAERLVNRTEKFNQEDKEKFIASMLEGCIQGDYSLWIKLKTDNDVEEFGSSAKQAISNVISYVLEKIP